LGPSPRYSRFPQDREGARATRYLYGFPNGRARYYTDRKTIYEHPLGKPAFYINGGTVYFFRGGKPVYWIGGECLYEYGGGGRPALYFG
jgi:hypothetical protein